MRIREIQIEVCKHYGVTLREMLSTTRFREFVEPRQVAMILCRLNTNYTLVKIGKEFNKGYTSVLYALKQIDKHSDNITLLQGVLNDKKS